MLIASGIVPRHVILHPGERGVEPQTTASAQRLLNRALGTELRPTITSPPQPQRRAVFTGKRTKSGAFLGFHARGTSQIVPINSCTLVYPDISAGFDGLKALVQTVRDIVGDAKLVADLFSGCGTFTLPLVKSAEVTAFESDAAMLAALDKGWRSAIGLKKVETTTHDLFRNPLREDELEPFDAVVIDPPRAGAKVQTDLLAASAVNKVAFVSCYPAIFARDARILVDGGFTLDWVQTVDQFLWSSRCELVAQFSRN